MQEGKWLSEEALQIAEKRRKAKGKEEKERYIRYIDIFDISLAIANISKDIKISRILKSASFAYHGKQNSQAYSPLYWVDFPCLLYIDSIGSDKLIQGIRSNRVPKELWMKVCDIVQQAVIKTIPKKKKCKKAKWLSKEGLQIAEKRREAKGKGEEERHTHLNAEFQRVECRVPKS